MPGASESPRVETASSRGSLVEDRTLAAFGVELTRPGVDLIRSIAETWLAVAFSK